MKTMIALVAVFGIGLAVLVARSIRARANRRNDPIGYYLGWAGYTHPITLEKKVTKEEAWLLSEKRKPRGVAGLKSAIGKGVEIEPVRGGCVTST